MHSSSSFLLRTKNAHRSFVSKIKSSNCNVNVKNMMCNKNFTRFQTRCLATQTVLNAKPFYCYPLHNESRQYFWGVVVAFNQVDEERVKLAGPDRAAAEWVLRNGGSIKWTSSKNQLSDYNFLPCTDFDTYKLEEIDLTNCKVIGLGFDHLKNLKHVQKIKLHGCVSIMDDALERLYYVKDTLKHLEISGCPMITDDGLKQIVKLSKLKTLILNDLQDVPDLTKSVNQLKSAMPWCEVYQGTDEGPN